MNHVQELIDENKDKMPTALAKQLLDACKEEADATKLYKLTWTMVDSYTHLVEDEDEPNHVEVKLSHKTQTLIVEAVDKKPVVHNGLPMLTMQVPNHGKVFTGWVKQLTMQPTIPLVILPTSDGDSGLSDDRMVIVHSIVPFHKRAREDAVAN